MLPDNLRNYLETEHALHIETDHLVAGGCINNASCLHTDQGKFFLKWNLRSPAGMFPCEARGLELIAGVGPIRVPEVLSYRDPSPGGIPGFILMDWIESSLSRKIDMAALGEQLALLHLNSSPQNLAYGLDHDNFLGSSPQKNTWTVHWPAFFFEQRLGFQADLAIKNGRLPFNRRKRLEGLLAHVDQILPRRTDLRPALLHGDLWSGNVISNGAGEPVLIDPAVYYGDREAEIAYTELFGGFNSRFYQAYQSTFPLDQGYTDRRGLYNLYHLLNHLNLFGEMYGAEVDSILEHYAV